LKNKVSIYQSIQNKIEKSCELYRRKLEKETDELKRLKLGYKITNTSLTILLNEMKKLSESDWEKFAEEYFEPVIKHSESILERLDNLVMKQSRNVREYEKYQKIMHIITKGNEETLDIIDSIDLNKKQLNRLIALLFRVMINTENAIRQNNLNFFEFNEAGSIVQRRFGFDYNWLICLSLIQLHENMIKKKIVELGSQIERDDKMPQLISKLSKLIEDKEKRKVSVSLLLSNGIKNVRDTMTHEGYKHSVSKEDLENIFEDILKLERTLYPEIKLAN
jgi:hypothetical protein